ncbi:protein unc-50-like [Paramacrobiotus metropolitanus]|uniref:protein unc-50-like n=1 Tax=Paramacrobiotus metropolitanus TaxID=2943436 RepID=UPI0024464AD0|nr:protein unc-50-like [Paramacrobiotus metropolitanus]
MAITLTIPSTYGCSERLSAAAKRWRFLRRLKRYDQMDFQFAAWQMVNLIIAPRKVYRHFVSRKETKNQFARDDPAFLVLFAGFLCLSSALMTVMFHHGPVQFLGYVAGFFKLLAWTVFVDCIGTGLLIATALWTLTNHLFRSDLTQDVEWGYSFDIHLNAAFPFLACIHVVQPLFYENVLNSTNLLSVFLGDTIYLLACSYYVYITFLGYSSLPYLRNTKRFLTLLPLLLATYVVCIVMQWNISRTVVSLYQSVFAL